MRVRCFTRLGGVAGRCLCCQGRSSGEVNIRALETHPLHAQRAEEGSVWCRRPPVHAQHVEERAEAQ